MDDSILPAIRQLEARHWWFRARLELTEAITTDCLTAGARLLDIGCGTGLFLERMRPRIDGWGLDPAPAAVAYCHERGLTQVHHGAIEQLPALIPGSFDAVTMWDVLEHVADDRAALDTVHGALRPGGALLLTVPAYQWLWSPHDTLHHHFRRYSRARLQRLLTSAGFRVTTVTHFNTYLLPFALVERLARRWTGHSPTIMVPPTAINESFYAIFKSERRRLTGTARKGFPVGLSLLAVAVRV